MDVYDKQTIMQVALEQIWEMDPDEPYETIREMQKIAMKALERCGFAQLYLVHKK